MLARLRRKAARLRATSRLVVATTVVTATGLAVGVALVGCPAFDEQIWCGLEWSAQISGAKAYDVLGQSEFIQASKTNHSECMSVADHEVLDLADP